MPFLLFKIINNRHSNKRNKKKKKKTPIHPSIHPHNPTNPAKPSQALQNFNLNFDFYHEVNGPITKKEKKINKYIVTCLRVPKFMFVFLSLFLSFRHQLTIIQNSYLHLFPTFFLTLSLFSSLLFPLLFLLLLLKSEISL